MNDFNRGTASPAGPSGTLEAIRVTAPGRLHIGFLDLDGSLGRRFGSLGLTLERPTTRVLIERSDAPTASGPDGERALDALLRLAEALPEIDPRLKVTVERALPAHGGLGSGTQLALAVACGAAALRRRPLTAFAAAEALGRGARSAIGAGAFATGGVLLDGGKPLGGPKRGSPPPIVSRVDFPEAWRILLIFDASRSGLSGADEREAMSDLPAFPGALADRLCRLALMGAMPAAIDGDVMAFGRAVGEIQRRVGDHFAPSQGGRFTSPDVAEALALLEAAGTPGVGQSSWGPTGFAIFGDPAAAAAAAEDLRRRFADRPGLSFEVVRGNNSGARIDHLTSAGAGARPVPAGERHVV